MSIEDIRNRLSRMYGGDYDRFNFQENAPHDISYLLEQNQRLVEALEYYEQCDLVITSHNCDAGERARNALKSYKLLENDL